MGKTRDLFKKIRYTKGTFHAKMGSIKEIKGMDLTEAEHMNKRWQEYTEQLYKKDHHNPDNHDDVLTHLEPDILECEVKWRKHHCKQSQWRWWNSSWAIWNPKRGCCESAPFNMWGKFGKLSSGHGTGKGQFSFQSQRKAMPRNAQTTAQLHSYHMLAK